MKKIFLAAALSAFTLPVYADATINAKLSTLGMGLEAAFPLTDSVDGRLGFNSFKRSITKSATSNGLNTDYSGNLNLGSVEALADWHPAGGGFRLSGGLVFNNNKFELNAQPNGSTINVGGVPYPTHPGDYVDAAVVFNKVAPYLGFGWGRTPKNTGLSFTGDIGVVFQGNPKANVTTNIAAAQSSIPQANSDLNDAVKSFNVYPVLSIGVGYTF